jgi:hypothetical protein
MYIITSYGINMVSFVQNPTVPIGTFTVYQADGITPITSSSDQTAIWTWNAATTSFNTTIQIKNSGATTINATVIITGLNPAWTPNGEGNYIITPGYSQPIKLSIGNPNAIAGEQVGQFTIIVGA